MAAAISSAAESTAAAATGVLERFARLLDDRAAAVGIVGQVGLLLGRLVDHLALVAPQFAGHFLDPFGQFAHGDLGRLDADVVWLAAAPIDKDLQVAGQRVGDVAEGAGGRAVGEHDDVASCQRIARKIRQYAAIGDLQAGTVVVEGSRDGDRDVPGLGVDDADGLAQALGFVIAGARTGAGDQAAVGLGGRNRIRRGIAVDLAGREEQHALERAGLLLVAAGRVVEHVAQAVDVGVDRFQRELAVVHRRGDRGRVDDVVRVADSGRDRVGHVVLDQDDVVALHAVQPGRHAADVVVQHRQADTFVRRRRLVPVGDRQDQVIAEEARAAGQPEPLARQFLELRARLADQVLEVAGDQLLERNQVGAGHLLNETSG